MVDSDKILSGFPIVTTDAVPEGELVVARLPTVLEVITHDSYEAAVEAMGSEYGIKARIINLPTDNE